MEVLVLIGFFSFREKEPIGDYKLKRRETMKKTRPQAAERKLFTSYTVEHYANKWDEFPVSVYECEDREEAEQEAEVLAAGLERCEGAVVDEAAFFVVYYGPDGHGDPETVKGLEAFADFFHEMSREALVEFDNLWTE